ncbi:MAG: DUF6763 family protein [Gammaproteobacteria bacterium]
MQEHYEPSVGDWYRDAEGRSFEIVAVDEEDGSIEVQYFDGAVEEYDIETWYELEIEPTAPPEDWSGPYDDLEKDDLGDTEVPMHPEDWNGPWDDIEREDY